MEEVYTVQEGLADDKVCAILPGVENELWISTYNGLSRLNLKSKSFRNFYTSDGLPTNEFNQGSALAGTDGKLYFGSINGIVYFNPDFILPPIKEPQVMLTKLVQHKGLENKIAETVLDIYSLQKIKLYYKDRFFTVYFALKDYFNSEAHSRFAYKLDGIMDEWQNIGVVNYIQFAGLPAGNYTLRIKGMGSDGIWGKKELQIPVSVSAAFYATAAAYILYTIAALTIIAVIFHFRIGRIRLQNKLQLEHLQKEKLQELDQIKSRFFTNITHEFRTPLTLIISPLEQLLGQQLPEPEMIRQHHNVIYRNAQRLLRLINQLLDSAKLEAGSMNLTETQGDVISFVNNIVGSFRLQADKKGIRLQFPSVDNSSAVYFFDAEKLENIIYNLLSNALKFTSAGGTIIVELTFRESAEMQSMLYLRVTDTGIGIAAQQLPFVFDRFYQANQAGTLSFEGSGLGLFLVKELAELLGGTWR
ncbi:MAG: ATP-binding protein [Segetibacter sp.]